MRLVFDLETNGLYLEATKIWCICAEDIDTGEKYEWTLKTGKTTTLLEQLGRDFFMDSATELIGHNILNFDLPVLKNLWNWEPNENVKITDTLVMSRLSNPDRTKPSSLTSKSGPHSLESWGHRVGKSKPEHEEWNVFSAAMLRRCQEDVGINILTYHSLRSELTLDSNKDWEDALRIEHAIARVITKQEHRGIHFNKDKAEECVHELTRKIDDIDREVLPRLPYTIKQRGATVLAPFTSRGEHSRRYREDISYCSGPFCRIDILPFELGSTGKVKDYLLSHGWMPETWNYSDKTGERTSPKLVGEFLGVEGDLPHKVKERLTWCHRRSQIEGWIKRLRAGNLLTAAATPCGTNTGRMRHSIVVNLPKAIESVPYGIQMRSLFQARPGYKLVGHDASGIQLRMLAHYMGDEDFIQAILIGDIHEFNRRAAGLPDRDAAKTFIYALIFGAGDEKLGSIIGGTEADGARLRAQFFKSLPKLEKLINRTKRQSGKGWLQGLDGRKVRMRRDRHGRLTRNRALNVLLQSAEAIVMKQSCITLWDSIEATDIEAYKVLDMHDEGQSEVNPKDIELYSHLAVQSIKDAGIYFNLNIPLDAEAKVGMNLAETH